MSMEELYAKIKQGDIVGIELKGGRFKLAFNADDLQLATDVGSISLDYDDLDDLADLLHEAVEIRSEAEVNKLRRSN